VSGRTSLVARVIGAVASTVVVVLIGVAVSASALAAPKHGNAATRPSAATSTAKATPSMATPGYWIADASGQVGSYGGVPFRSSLQATQVNAPTVDLVPTQDGGGYWLAGADGGVFAFGDAGYFGGLVGRALNGHVVALAATSSDQGYWLAAADGGVFAFGDATYYGSPEGSHLAASVIALMPTADTRGYWLVSADGGVFAYGDARFAGSLAGSPLRAPIVGAAATADGRGYWMVAADGGVFAFGDARYYGSLSTTALNKKVVGIAPTPDGRGYWLAAADGGVFAFGDATFRGSASGEVPSNDGIVSVATGPGIADHAYGPAGNFTAPVPQSVGAEVPGAVGYDISWPQCGGALPAPSTLAIVGVNNGSAFTTNPCFAREAAWAGLNLSVYINLSAPDPAHPQQFANGPAGACPPGAAACDSYNYGYNAAVNSIAQLHFAGYAPKDVWLDVETSNVWSPDTALNDQVIAGAISALEHAGATPGVYSTAYQYSVIAGAFRSSVPEWLATGIGLAIPSPGCATASFTGGRVTLVQGFLGPLDGDFAC